uniref:Uncharacterized protein n=1 Tax=Meloidogyne enterolobii TaxID=390850 RepID=A0A6V7WLY2_MELEN|nr:unnamed protein product [Meloidogyne enterolobii]
MRPTPIPISFKEQNQQQFKIIPINNYEGREVIPLSIRPFLNINGKLLSTQEQQQIFLKTQQPKPILVTNERVQQFQGNLPLINHKTRNEVTSKVVPVLDKR